MEKGIDISKEMFEGLIAGAAAGIAVAFVYFFGFASGRQSR